MNKITKQWLNKERMEIKQLKRKMEVFEKVGDSPETIETLKTAIKVRTKRLARKKLEVDCGET